MQNVQFLSVFLATNQLPSQAGGEAAAVLSLAQFKAALRALGVDSPSSQVNNPGQDCT